MRKRYKNKKRACGLCKPWKRGWAKNRSAGELAMLHETEKLARELQMTLQSLSD